jgi:chaperonin cofactor prefoldin
MILDEDDEQITQPKHITVSLMNHQKTIIHKMLELEKSNEINIKYKLNKKNDDMDDNNIVDGILNTNIAVLGDKVGAGKTLTTISLISVNPILKSKKMYYHQINSNVSIKIKDKKQMLNTNLIIVPHKLIPQWKTALSCATNLSVYFISTNKHIDDITTIVRENIVNWNNTIIQQDIIDIIYEKVNDFNVILISDTMYKRFSDITKKYKWNRIFIDEIDSIKLSKNIVFYFNFIWLITATPSGLSRVSNLLVNKLVNNILNYIILKNDVLYIDKSIILPPALKIKIKCITPKELHIIHNLIPSSILQMINAGNSEEAIKTLNCNIDTSDNILQIITKKIMNSITKKETKLSQINDVKVNEERIAKLKKSIERLYSRYDIIKKKIYELNDDFCPICMGSFTDPVILNCCKNCFCFNCLAISVGTLKNNTCPYCRQGIEQSDIHLISTNDKKQNIKKTVTTDIKDIKDKMDTLVDLIQKKPDGSFIIFANYSKTFQKIEAKLQDLNIRYHVLKGQANAVNNHIEDFKKKTVNVLMLNAKYFGAGMNLQMTTDLIIYHRFTSEIEEQIIGRAQRLGRTSPLNIYYLIHDNESENIN